MDRFLHAIESSDGGTTRRCAATSCAAGRGSGPARAARPGRAGPIRRAAARPATSRASADVTGARIPADSIARASSGTVSSASTACPRRSGISAAGTPWLRSSPALRLRDFGASAVATRSPVPARPRNVRTWPPRLLRERGHLAEDVAGRHPGRVQPLRLGRADGDRGGVLRAPGQLDADGIVRDLADHARHAGTRPAQRCASRSECEAHTSPAPSVAISRACAGPPMHATRSGAERGLERERRRHAVRRDEALRERHDRRPRRPRPDARARRAHPQGPSTALRGRPGPRDGTGPGARPSARTFSSLGSGTPGR